MYVYVRIACIVCICTYICICLYMSLYCGTYLHNNTDLYVRVFIHSYSAYVVTRRCMYFLFYWYEIRTYIQIQYVRYTNVYVRVRIRTYIVRISYVYVRIVALYERIRTIYVRYTSNIRAYTFVYVYFFGFFYIFSIYVRILKKYTNLYKV